MTRDCVRFKVFLQVRLAGDMRIGEWIADLHANFGRRDLTARKYVFPPTFDGGVFLREVGFRRKPER